MGDNPHKPDPVYAAPQYVPQPIPPQDAVRVNVLSQNAPGVNVLPTSTEQAHGRPVRASMEGVPSARVPVPVQPGHQPRHHRNPNAMPVHRSSQVSGSSQSSSRHRVRAAPTPGSSG